MHQLSVTKFLFEWSLHVEAVNLDGFEMEEIWQAGQELR